MKEEIWNELYLYLYLFRIEIGVFKISRNVLARPVMGTIFLVNTDIPLRRVEYLCCRYVSYVKVGGVTWTKHAHAQSLFFRRLNQ